VLDLELLHHFTQCCCIKVPSQHRRDLWTQQVVKLAFEHRYVLDQLLATSALHCMSIIPERAHLFLPRALLFRDRALRTVQPILQDMQPSHSVPIFAFAGLAMIYSFAERMIRADAEGSEYDPIRHLIECLQINHGIATIVSSQQTAIEGTWAEDLIRLSSENDLYRLRVLDLKAEGAAALHEMIDEHEPSAPRRAAAHDILNIFSSAIQIIAWRGGKDDIASHLIHSWTTHASPEFWLLLESQSPVALALIAYLAALVSLQPGFWWFEAWPAMLMARIRRTLGDEYGPALKWPQQLIDARLGALSCSE
jgi:hypothetical protein